MKLIYILASILFLDSNLYANGLEFGDLSYFMALPLGVISVIISVSVNLVDKGSSKGLNVFKIVLTSFIFILFFILDIITLISLFSSTLFGFGGPTLILLMGILFLTIGFIALIMKFKRAIPTNK